MSKSFYKIKQSDGFPINPHSLAPPYSVTSLNGNPDREKESNAPLSININSSVLLAIIVVAIIFSVCCLLRLLFRFVAKMTSFSTIRDSNRFPESSGSQSFRRQLQQLFRQHDTGLDLAFVEALPVFYYRDIVGLKEPFDCAVCLCEFSHHEKLRLLPMCSHAFHIECIDTWLLSNTTCPLCRGTLSGSSFPMEDPNFDVPREALDRLSTGGETGSSDGLKPAIEDSGRRVFSVRLGKFRSSNEGECSGGRREEESSRCNLDARRCYSMGAVQYLEGDSNLKVAFFHGNHNGGEENRRPGHLEDKRIIGRTRKDSFSVSKIWLWSTKSRFPNCSGTNQDLSSSHPVSLSSKHITEITRDV